MFHCRQLFRLIMAAFVFCLCAPAYAGTDAENIAKLQTLFERVLDGQKKEATARGATLEIEGKIMVEPGGSYYAVTLPPLRITHEDGMYTEIGMIAINAMEGDTEGLWKMSAAVPTPITLSEKDGTPAMRIDFGGQNFSGIWDDAFGGFTRIRAEYRDIAIKDQIDDFFVAIPAATLALNLEADKEGRWSGPGEIELSGVSAGNAGAVSARIEKIAMTMGVSEYSVAEVNAYHDKLEAIAESELWDGKDASWNHILGMYNLVSEFISSVWDGYSVNIRIDGLASALPPSPDSQEGGSLSLESGGFGFSLSGLRQNNVALGITGHYKNLIITPPPESFDAAAPDQINLEIIIQNMPYNELVALGRETLKMIAESPASAQMIGMNAIATAPQVLTGAGTNLVLHDISASNNDYDIKLNGRINADIEAMMSVTGNAQMKIIGLERIIEQLKAQTDNPEKSGNAREDEELKKTAALLTLMQMMSQKQTNEAGKTVHLYNFSLSRDGKMTLNGTDMSVLLDAMGTSSTPASEPKIQSK